MSPGQRHAAQVVRAERELLVPQATKMAEIADAHLQVSFTLLPPPPHLMQTSILDWKGRTQSTKKKDFLGKIGKIGKIVGRFAAAPSF